MLRTEGMPGIQRALDVMPAPASARGRARRRPGRCPPVPPVAWAKGTAGNSRVPARVELPRELRGPRARVPCDRRCCRRPGGPGGRLRARAPLRAPALAASCAVTSPPGASWPRWRWRLGRAGSASRRGRRPRNSAAARRRGCADGCGWRSRTPRRPSPTPRPMTRPVAELPSVCSSLRTVAGELDGLLRLRAAAAAGREPGRRGAAPGGRAHRRGARRSGRRAAGRERRHRAPGALAGAPSPRRGRHRLGRAWRACARWPSPTDATLTRAGRPPAAPAKLSRCLPPPRPVSRARPQPQRSGGEPARGGLRGRRGDVGLPDRGRLQRRGRAPQQLGRLGGRRPGRALRPGVRFLAPPRRGARPRRRHRLQRVPPVGRVGAARAPARRATTTPRSSATPRSSPCAPRGAWSPSSRCTTSPTRGGWARSSGCGPARPTSSPATWPASSRRWRPTAGAG